MNRDPTARRRRSLRTNGAPENDIGREGPRSKRGSLIRWMASSVYPGVSSTSVVRFTRIAVVALGMLTWSGVAGAQSAPPAWCVPGTTLCVQGQGQGQGRGQGNGGATLGGGVSGQVGPNGAQAQGNAWGRGNAQGQAQGQARQASPEEPGEGPSGGRRRRARTGPPYAVGGIPCLVGRVGIWSGYHGGVCFALGVRGYSGVGFELESVVLAGGTVPTLDLLLRPTLVIPLAGRRPYFDQLSMKIGHTIVGGSIPLEGQTSYLRFGGSVGLGYDVALTDSLAWRVLEASFYAEVRVGSHRAAYMDRLNNSWDLGLMTSTGLFFH